MKPRHRNSCGISADGPMGRVQFRVDGEPMSKARARVTRHGAYTPIRTRQAEDAVRAAFLAAYPGRTHDSGVNSWAVALVFDRSTRVRRDWDNLAKLVTDALNGLVWADDSQIIQACVTLNRVPRGSAGTTVTADPTIMKGYVVGS